jgi:phosphotriesterase-related protein
MHEHVFLDLRAKFAGTMLEQSDELVTSGNIGILRENHRLFKDNLFLADEESAFNELIEFKLQGGGTVVDMSNRGMGGDPIALKRLSRAIGINIVECTGFYTEAVHPGYVWKMSAEELAELMIHDIAVGVEDTGIPAGIIGEIGTSAHVTGPEWRVLEAAALAQRKTGASVSVHIDPWTRNGLEVLVHLERCGADLNRVIIGHVDAVLDLDYCRKMLRTGCVIELDNFAKTYRTPGLHFDTDAQRVEAILVLAEEGFSHQIVMSTDICLKTDLYRYGGGGYGYIPRTIIPWLKKAGLPDEVIHNISMSTPARLLDF